MSLNYKFGQSGKGTPEKQEEKNENQKSNDIEYYDASSNVRNVCFVQPNGQELFLNYAYLISGEFSPIENLITLTFTTHVITLKGNSLENLFKDLTQHSIKKITCFDKRYRDLKKDDEIFITEIHTKINHNQPN